MTDEAATAMVYGVFLAFLLPLLLAWGCCVLVEFFTKVAE